MIALVQRQEVQELDLGRFLAALRRRRLTIIAAALLMVASALVLSFLQKPVYQGEARLALDPPGSSAVFEPVTAAARIDPALLIETEIEVIESERVQAAVREALGPVPDVEAARVGDTLLVEVKGSAGDPVRAASVTNAYVRAYLELRRQQAADELLETGAELRTKVGELQSQIDALDRATNPERYDALVQQQSRFSERLDQLEIEAALQSGGAQLISEARVPDGRVSPRPARNATLALVVGTILGAAVALFREYRDDTIKTRDDFARVAQPVPVLASIPSVAGWQKEPRRPHVVTRTGTEDASIAAEAYRTLRTAVRLLGVERPQRTIQFTSAMPGEGKTTTLANLALVLVSAGQRVVMVDCDLRRPSLHTAFGLTNADGFTSVLAGEQELMAAIQRVPGEPALALLGSGAPPPNPSELLGSKQTSELLFALQSQFDIVLVDSPPVLSVTDASVLSLWVDTTLVVASAGVTLKKQLGAALEVLRQADASVSGAVLNRVEAQPGYGYGYYGERTDQEGAGTRSKERSVELGPQLGPATSDDEIRTLDQRRGA